jgi:hypothetical protein
MSSSRATIPVLLALALAAAGCASPPSKELNQADGAIQAARAAGAESFAAEELSQATSTLAEAEAAVSLRDYRLALAHALDALELAQQAAARAATEKARVRAGIEHTLTGSATALKDATSRAADLERTRPKDTRLPSLREHLATAGRMLQEARSAVDREAFGEASALAAHLETALKEAGAVLDQPAVTSSRGRR